MINTAINALRDRLVANAPFLSVVGGLAESYDLQDGDRVRTVPVWHDPANDYKAVHLTPNSRESGVGFFEVTADPQTQVISGGRTAFILSARFVAWLNFARLAPRSTADAQALLLSALTGNLGDAAPVYGLRSSFNGLGLPKDAFSRYDLNQAENKLLSHPHATLAVDLKLFFVAGTSACAVPVVQVDKSC